MPVRSQTLLEALALAADRDPHDVRQALGTLPVADAELVGLFAQRALLPLDQGYRVWAGVLGLPFHPLAERDLDPRLLRRLPLDAARRHGAIVVEEQDGLLGVALRNPMDLIAVDAIQELTGMPVQTYLAAPDAIQRALDRLERGRWGIENLIARAQQADVDLADAADADQLRRLVGDDAVIQLVDYLIDEALRVGASDVHVEPQRGGLRVRVRVDGDLELLHSFPPGLHRAVVARIKVLAGMDIGENRKPQDGRIAVDAQVELRVSVLPSVLGEKAVLRVLNRGGMDLALERLAMAPDNLERFRRAWTAANGMVLLTGPTGSGKTTTLYAVMSALNTEEVNLITVEDPVEYEMAGTTQVQVDPRAERTFAGALRAMLRQDPDVVMVGEIRDHETAAIAVQAALTGHLVLSTLHANDALATVHRLLDMEVAPYLLAPALRGIVGQRLVPRVCPDCAVPATAPPGLLAAFGLDPAQPPTGLRQGTGCRACRNRGRRGRIAIHEVLTVDERLAALIARRAPMAELREAAAATGYRPLLQDGLAKALQGLVTLADVLAAARAD